MNYSTMQNFASKKSDFVFFFFQVNSCNSSLNPSLSTRDRKLSEELILN